MTTKLNLTIDEKIARRIKAYAARKNKSVSSLTEEYYNSLLNGGKKAGSLADFLDKYAGSIKRKKPIDLGKERDQYLRKKYGV
jgi:hypothetical protein